MFISTRFSTLLLTAAAVMTISWQASAAPLLNGVAVHTELGKEQFIAGLYTDSLSTDANKIFQADENKRVQVRVLADTLSSRRFKRMWIEGIAINSNQAALQAHAQNMADFSNMLRVKLVAGDILTIDRSRDDGLSVALNGTTLGEIEDEAFFDLLLLTWIGPVPLSSGFRDNLLSQGDVPSQLLSRFESTRPTDARIAAVERAIRSANEEEKQARAEAVAAAGDDKGAGLKAVPTLDKPELAMAPPALGPAVPPAPPAPKPAAKPEPKPEPAPKEQTQVAKAAPAKPKPVEDDVLEDDDEESFTAESLLSQQLYIGKLKSWAQKELSYPTNALRRNWEGNVRLDVTIDRAGKLKSIEVAEEAEHAVLTKEALRAAKKASPYPAMPEDVKGDTFLFTLPVAFKLQ